MLRFPENGMLRSVNTHNVNFDILCDWIEASAYFGGSVSPSDVVDELLENEVYADQDFAYEAVDIAWIELHRRCRWLKTGSHIITTNDVVQSSQNNWEKSPPVAFCLLLSLARCYSTWVLAPDGNYVDQGNLFECIVKESLQMQGWEVYRTGWASGINQRKSFEQLVRNVADEIHEPYFSLDLTELYATKNEMGLDLVCYKLFFDKIDDRVGKPVIFVQCASGSEIADDKLRTPDIKLWGNVIQFASTPKQGYATPLAIIENKTFYKHTAVTDGILLDRYRILSPCQCLARWWSDELNDQLTDWLNIRVGNLPY